MNNPSKPHFPVYFLSLTLLFFLGSFWGDSLLSSIYNFHVLTSLPQEITRSLSYGFVAFLIGSIPFGLILAKTLSKKDPRGVGSGNIGTTNVLRTAGKKVAALTLLLDLGKGWVGVFLAPQDPLSLWVAGVLLVLGHVFSIFLKGQGGKGFATFLGVLLALNPGVGGLSIAIAVWVIYKTRMVSVGALVSTGLSPVIAFSMGYPGFALFCVPMALLIYGTHRDNILRLLQGRESRIGDSSKGGAPVS